MWRNLFSLLADDATWSSSKCSGNRPLLVTDFNQNFCVGMKILFPQYQVLRKKDKPFFSFYFFIGAIQLCDSKYMCITV